MIWSVPAFAIGRGFTVRIILSIAEQLFISVTVTVYSVVIVGLATGFGIFEALKPELGLQAYIIPPEAFKLVLFPMQIALSGPALAGGKG